MKKLSSCRKMKKKPLGIKILEREIQEGSSIVQKEIDKNPKILKSDIMMYIPGLIAARATIKLLEEMFKAIINLKKS
jgi:hypothetical protein